MGLSAVPLLLEHVRRLARAAAPDEQLLADYLARPKGDAFAALVGRHGPMVLDLCRRILGDAQAAEDAFQATFLVLARRAGAVRRRTSLAGFLHGVAYRLAIRARRRRASSAGRPLAREATPDASPGPAESVAWQELLAVLHQELARLSDPLRAPLVLCYLQGRTQDEAARQLGWSLARLRRRLERGRQVLAARLRGRGLSLPAALAGLLAAGTTAVPAPLAAAALEAAQATGAARLAGSTFPLSTTGLLSLAVPSGRKLAALSALVLTLGLGLWLNGSTSRQPGAAPAPTPNRAPASGQQPPPRGEPEIDVIGAGETAMEMVKTTKDPDARWMGIRILGSLRYQRAVPLLLESLADPHPYIRSNAARALGDMKVAAAARPLTELLAREANGGVIQQTSLALTRLRCTEGLPALKAAAKHEDVQTRMWVLQAIGGLGGKREVRFLAGYLQDPSEAVQSAAAQAIEQITGLDFGFPRRSGPSSPTEGLRRAKAWWQEHQGEFRDP
jgi:RNA polymerase sigma factor (sigma-70 family)